MLAQSETLESVSGIICRVCVISRGGVSLRYKQFSREWNSRIYLSRNSYGKVYRYVTLLMYSKQRATSKSEPYPLFPISTFPTVNPLFPQCSKSSVVPLPHPQESFPLYSSLFDLLSSHPSYRITSLSPPSPHPQPLRPALLQTLVDPHRSLLANSLSLPPSQRSSSVQRRSLDLRQSRSSRRRRPH